MNHKLGLSLHWMRIGSAWGMHGRCMVPGGFWPDSTGLRYQIEELDHRLCGDICCTEWPCPGSSKRRALGAPCLGRYLEGWKDGALPAAFKKSQPPTSPLLRVIDDSGSHRSRGRLPYSEVLLNIL